MKNALAAFLAGYASSIPFAHANVVTPGEESLSILTRYNPSYDPAGVRLGDFIARPSLDNGIEYNDNVYARREGQVDDFLYIVKPSLNVRSDFVRHEIAAAFSLQDASYRENTGEDYTDYQAALSGRLDITGQTSVPLSLAHNRFHIRRGSPEDFEGSEPTVYTLSEATLGLIHRGHTLALKILGRAQRFLYDDTQGPAGLVDNSDRDLDDYSLYTSIGMAEEAFFAPFVYNNLHQVDYERDQDDFGFSRDAFEHETGIGTIFNFSRVTRAAFNIGYVNREQDDEDFSDIGALTYGIDLVWEPSTLAAFKLEGNRAVVETNVENASAAINSSLGLSMNYELFTNVELIPSITYRLLEYEDIDRDVENISAGVSATYKLNRNVWINGSYRYTTQEESGADRGFDEFDNNTVLLNLKLQF